MSKRITIMIDDDNLKTARRIQSKEIAKSTGSYSLSRAINDMLRGDV